MMRVGGGVGWWARCYSEVFIFRVRDPTFEGEFDQVWPIYFQR